MWTFLDDMMHRDADVNDSVLMQRQSIIESLQLMLIVDCLASAGQYLVTHALNCGWILAAICGSEPACGSFVSAVMAPCDFDILHEN